MGSWTFLSADSQGIRVRLHKEGSYADVLLPPTQDYFEDDGQGSEYIESNFDRLWEAHAVLGADPIVLTADKTQITADGIDVATVTADIPFTAEYCFVTINGLPAERADIIDGQVVREFSASTAGIFKVEFFAGNKIGTIFIEAV